MNFLLSALLCTGVTALTVSTKYGPVIGTSSEHAKIWRGIPYAAPPVRDLRWAAPVPPESWTDVRNATEFGPSCPQLCTMPTITCPVAISEDCLSLNIFTPLIYNTNQSLPVLFFIHGGGFNAGGGSMDFYDGQLIANLTITVVVTINYRLGNLGFLRLLPHFEGNYGFLDQQLALKWVNENIGFFGGDPARVTIFGESAGAMSVGAHLTAPSSWEFFNAAVMQSNPFAIRMKDDDIYESLNAKWLDATGCRDEGDIACFHGLTMEQLVAIQDDVETSLNLARPLSIAVPWTPVPDGKLIPTQPHDAMLAGRTRPNTPIYGGSTAKEGTMFVYKASPGKLGKTKTYALLTYLFGLGTFIRLRAAYNMKTWDDADCRDGLEDLITDYVMECPLRAALRNMPGQAKYAYYFDHVLSFPDVAWGTNFSFCATKSCHGCELPLLFGTPVLYDVGVNLTEGEMKLVDQLIWNWGAFATYNRPLHAPFNDGNGPSAFYRFDASNGPSGPSAQRKSKLCDMWDNIGYNHGFGESLTVVPDLTVEEVAEMDHMMDMIEAGQMPMPPDPRTL